MSQRPYIDKTRSAVYRALDNTTRVAKEAYEAAGLSPTLIELVDVRVSQINGCPTCLSIHVPGARKAGGAHQRLTTGSPSAPNTRRCRRGDRRWQGGRGRRGRARVSHRAAHLRQARIRHSVP